MYCVIITMIHSAHVVCICMCTTWVYTLVPSIVIVTMLLLLLLLLLLLFVVRLGFPHPDPIVESRLLYSNPHSLIIVNVSLFV